MIIIVNGSPASGKTTFINYCRGQMEVYKSRNFSTVELVKAIAKTIGWNGHKDLKSRKFLSDLKDLMTEFNDSPANDVIHKTIAFYNNCEMWTDTPDKDCFVFIDCREPNEIKKMVEKFTDLNLTVATLIVRRHESEEVETSNHADAGILEYSYDYEVINEGTLKDLEDMAEAFMEDLKNEYHN